jgi:outer membrane protein TolC
MNSKAYFYSLAITAVAFFNVFALKVSAQDSTKNLSLNNAIEATLKNNKNIQLAKLDGSISTANYQQTAAAFLPQIDLSYSAISTNNPLNAFGFKLQQGTITQNDFNPVLLNHPSQTPDFMTQLEVKQPLINMDMLYMRKGAEKQTEMYQYKTQRTQEYMTFEVKKAYLQLQLSCNALKVAKEALQTARSVYTYTDNRFKQGLIQKSDLLNANVHVIAVESSFSKAQSSIRNASDNLSLLMGQPLGVIYKINDQSGVALLGTDTSGQRILSTRADFMAMQKAIDASGLLIKSSQMSYLPKLNAFGNYQYNDSHLTGFGANAYLVGLQLSWNIFNGNKTKNVIIAQKLERDKLIVQLEQQKDQSKQDLNKAYRDLADARFEVEQEGIRILKDITESLSARPGQYY